MNIVDTASFAHDQFKQLSPDTTLVVLHPDFHGQHSLFAPVLENPAIATVFVSVNEQNLPFSDLLNRLSDALETQLGLPRPSLPSDPAGAAKTVAEHLNARGNVTLILDAYDQVEQEHSTRFMAGLARQLKPGSRVILGTRVLPMALLSHDDLHDRLALVPTDPDRMLLDYIQPPDKNVLEVRALGPGRVLINGRRIDHWDGVLPRMLFYYFVDRGMTTRDEIFATFWPKLSTREATNVFHVTKRKISEILDTDLTVYWSGFYRISPELELHYDVIKFAEAVQNAAVAPDTEAIALYKNAIALYNGPFLSTITGQEWIERRRSELLGSYAEALAGLARIYERQEDQREALGFYLRAAATNPQREDLARAIMGLYERLGQPADALATYERLEAELQATLGVAPDRQTIELAERIRAKL